MIRNFLPHFVCTPLWGDRRKYGSTIQEKDACWSAWQQSYLDFYHANQRQGVGTKVNDAGYKIMKALDLKDKTILEIGPGDIRHVQFWKNRPSCVILADVQQAMLDKSSKILNDQRVATQTLLMHRNKALPLEDDSVDIILTFYSLEHIYPLPHYLSELKRVLKSDGFLAGAIPAEGGVAWGGGRFITSRRWFKKNTRINPDKIICWEHPNFADHILSELDQYFIRQQIHYWPLQWLPFLDLNLVIRFVYRNRK